MKENASSVFNGIGYIKHGGTKSIANQESRVLMLSENARGDANPILLIDEDDVEAGHAASVGRVDPEQLYYLMSRYFKNRSRTFSYSWILRSCSSRITNRGC